MKYIDKDDTLCYYKNIKDVCSVWERLFVTFGNVSFSVNIVYTGSVLEKKKVQYN